MVFESIVTEVLNRFLGDYIENLDSKQLKLGIWGGDVVLTNLILKQSALSNLDLPVQTVYGRLEKLVLKIPWKNLYGASVEASIEGLLLLVKPNNQVVYNEEKEEKRYQEEKRAQLEKIENANKISETKSDDTFAEKLITQIIKNVQLRIKNIHIRYEEVATPVELSYAFGITLSELNVYTTDKDWNAAVINETVSKIFKIVNLEGFAVYWNCNPSLYSKLKHEDLGQLFKADIANKDSTPSHNRYILGPINSAARLKLNPKPENDSPPFEIPKAHAELLIENISIGISKNQYTDIIGFADSMNFQSRGLPYRKYRPNLTTYQGHYKEWWQFAYTCIVETQIKRRKREWDWTNMSQHRESCKEYGDAYKNKLNCRKVPKDLEQKLITLENRLDLFNIVLIRQAISLEVEKLGKEKQAQAASKGWFSGWFGSSSIEPDPTDTTNILNKFQEAMTSEEKEKLFKAIDYKENTSPVLYPASYIDTVVKFQLNHFNLVITHELHKVPIIESKLQNVKLSIERHPRKNSISVAAFVEQLTIYGFAQGKILPELVSSKFAEGKALLDVNFQLNPPEIPNIGKKLKVVAQPLRIVYDAETIKHVIDVFKVPESSALEKLSEVTAAQFNNFKEMSSTGMQYVIEQHSFFRIDITLNAPYILVPYKGLYTGVENVLVIDLGQISIQSSERRTSISNVRSLYKAGKTQEEMKQQMIKQCYDEMTFTLSKVQIMMAQGDEPWMTYIEHDDRGISDMHLLNPLNINVKFETCLISDDPHLPLTKLYVEIPNLHINITDCRMLQVLSLINSIPMDVEDDDNAYLPKACSSTSLYRIMDTTEPRYNPVRLPVVPAQQGQLQQLIMLQGKFILKELRVKLCTQEFLTSPIHDVLVFDLNTMEATVSKQTYDMKVDLKIDRISMEQSYNETILNIVQTPKRIELPEKLFQVTYTHVDKKSPEFKTVHGSCVDALNIHFATLAVKLHQEALKELMVFISELQAQYEEITTGAPAPRLSRSASMDSSVRFIAANLVPEQKKTQRVSTHVVIFSLTAKLDELVVTFETNNEVLSYTAIQGIYSNVLIRKNNTSVLVQLDDLTVMDLNTKTLYKKILTVEHGQKAITMKVLMNTKPIADVPDMQVIGSLARIKVAFVNRFITTMLNFLNEFQAAQQAIAEASQKAAQSAKENMQKVVNTATKILLDIELQAPIFIIPESSKSLDGVIVDLGHITISNKISDLNIHNERGSPVFIDELELTLEDLRIDKVKLNKQLEVQQQSTMLEPLSFSLLINRNLSAWYDAIPDFDVQGHINTIQLVVSELDYRTVIRILTINLTEGVKPNTVVTEATYKASEISHSLLINPVIREESVTDAVKTMVRWNFVMKCFKISLYTLAHAPRTSFDGEKIGLADFSLEGLAVRGRMLSNSTISISLLLVNCLWMDTRPAREGKINCLMSRIEDDDDIHQIDSTISVAKNMIDVTFQTKDTDTFIDVRVYSFNFIVSLEYLMRLSSFFNSAEDPHAKALNKQLEGRQSKTQTISQSNSMLTFTIKMEKPYIVLVEHMESINTRALIMNFEMLVKFRMLDKHQNINGTIKDLQMYTCVYDPKVRENTKSTVLEPVTISIAGSTPETKGLHMEVFISDIYIGVSLATIELLNNISQTLYGTNEAGTAESVHYKNFSDMWEMAQCEEDEFWFLKNEDAEEAAQFDFQSIDSDTKLERKLHELCIVNVPVLLITLQAGVGTKTFPMLLLHSGLEAKINDWSWQMIIEGKLKLEMDYYNSLLALWEPLIEPMAIIEDSNVTYKPWELSLEVTLNEPTDDSIAPNQSQSTSQSPSDSDTLTETQQLTAAMQIDIFSHSSLELTLTKTGLEVLTQLGRLFATAIAEPTESKDLDAAAYKVINVTGLDITLEIGHAEFVMTGNEHAEMIKLENNVEVSLNLKARMSGHTSKNLLRVLTDSDASTLQRHLFIYIPELDTRLELPVTRADRRYFKMRNGSASWGLISSVKVDNGVTIVTLSSIIDIYNNFNIPIDIYYMRNSGNELEYINTIQPDGVLNVPMQAVYSNTAELFFSVNGYSVTTTPFVWKDLQLNVSVNKNLICQSKTNDDEAFVIRAVGEMKQVYFENTLKHTMTSTLYNIYLRPAIKLKNCLPIDILLCVRDLHEEKTISPGDSIEIPNVEPGKSYIVIRLPHYLDKEWSCRRDLDTNPPQFSVWSFHSYNSPMKITLDLGMHILDQNGTSVMSLYCPFWMINKTGLMLSYRKSKKTERNEASGSPLKSSDENLNILHHPPFFKEPILFSFNARNFFGKKKACVKIEQGDWSDKFSIDVAGSSGVVVCKYQGKYYQIGVSNRLMYNGLTKQITFTPYYVIINQTHLTIECQEMERPADPWTCVVSRSCTAFWPCSEKEDKLIRLRIAETEEVTAPFLITESHTTLLKVKNKYGGINVDIQLTEGAVYVNLVLYDDGMAPALIINNTQHTMNLWEKESIQIRKLPAGYKMYYTWDNPSSQRILVWEGGYRKEIENDLRMDGVGNYPITENLSVYWVSFLDGMQRVLLFTTDASVAENAQSSKQFEVIDREITLSIHGVGLSIVNNLKRQEILYVGMAGTGIIWECCKLYGKRYKALNAKDNALVERAYQNFLLQVDPGTGGDVRYAIENMEINFYSMEMLKPHRRLLQRRFETGLWLQMRSSEHQSQIHAKINRLQIDNQLYDCTFPVLLAPVPPPKSIALNNVHKPFAELSIVQLLGKNSQIQQYKYFKLLIQEFHVKVDLGLINSLLDILDTTEFSENEERTNFLTDMEVANENLYVLVSQHSIQEQKSFYDLLHFSPLKIHVSFSMSSGSSAQGSASRMPVFLSVLLQGIGVTLTDLQDVVFKLAYFQREYSFLTQRQLMREASTHYMGQTVKQLYVLVLGLDVIGNPYGLVLGITKGVEDLFYEPFQGAIQGPGEFAEGLVLGVASLFGHTVGGAAGAVSRITGAMGKGIAALTFDKEYQRKRRDQINKQPATVQEGIARGGKGLVMGVFDGVTGVFTKPISGAKEQGVGGFFKGLGKGAVGLVTRPTAGVMDFASTSFGTVKRVTDFGHEFVNRLRTPRFVQADLLVRPYNEISAQGNKLLCELEKGKFYNTDIYSCHFVIIEKKEVLLLSNKRLAYIIRNDLFGIWQVDWSYTWQEIVHPPTLIANRGVQIHVEARKKASALFGTGDNGKIILLNDDGKSQIIINRIARHLGSFSNM